MTRVDYVILRGNVNALSVVIFGICARNKIHLQFWTAVAEKLSGD